MTADTLAAKPVRKKFNMLGMFQTIAKYGLYGLSAEQARDMLTFLLPVLRKGKPFIDARLERDLMSTAYDLDYAAKERFEKDGIVRNVFSYTHEVARDLDLVYRPKGWVAGRAPK